jgi:2-oxoglutarate ferredoxin oxidoreductase subunit alpha
MPEKDYILTGAKGREARIIRSVRLVPADALEKHNIELQKKFKKMMENETRCESYLLEDAELVVVAFGLSSRVARATILTAREKGMKVGLLRPITLWPFPSSAVEELSRSPRVKAFIDVEMNYGQMIEDVKLAACGRKEVHFYGRTAGMVPEEDELLAKIVEVYR